MAHEDDSAINCNWCTWNGPQKLGKGTGRLKTSGDHPNYSFVETGQNTEKSPGDLRKLTVSCEKPSLVGKTLKGVNNKEETQTNAQKDKKIDNYAQGVKSER